MMNKIKQAQQWFQNADYIIIGAGAGLSDAAGFHYSGKRFHTLFHDFEAKYHIRDMYSGTFYPFSSEEEKWAYWAKMIDCNTYSTSPTSLYQKLLHLVSQKEYFVLTTNTDSQFLINGFDKQRYFETQGNFVYLQCQKGCHKKVYYNKALIKQMLQQTNDCKIPIKLVPKCPHCGGKMEVHVRKDNNFVETKGWKYYQKQYLQFLKNALQHNVLFLEFGVGFNTPSIIRYPFERMVYEHPNAQMIRFNKDFAFCLEGNEDNVICFDDDIETILDQLGE